MTHPSWPGVASAILLAAGLGAALLGAAVVAPAAFAVLPTRTLAGALVGRVLPVIFWSGMLVGIAVLVVAYSAGAGVISFVGGAIVVVGCAVAQLVISPRIERIRDAVAGPIDALGIAD